MLKDTPWHQFGRFSYFFINEILFKSKWNSMINILKINPLPCCINWLTSTLASIKQCFFVIIIFSFRGNSIFKKSYKKTTETYQLKRIISPSNRKIMSIHQYSRGSQQYVCYKDDNVQIPAKMVFWMHSHDLTRSKVDYIPRWSKAVVGRKWRT